MKHENHKEKSFSEVLGDHKFVSRVFLGVGLALFLLNISSFLAFMPITYDYLAFTISLFNSMLIIIYSVYMLSQEK